MSLRETLLPVALASALVASATPAAAQPASRRRSVDVAPMKDGSLLVSDDFAGAIYRISYGD